MSKNLVLVFLLIFLFCAKNAAQTKELSPNFVIQKIADGVYAVVRKEPPSLWFNPNTVFLIGKKDVIVVDSNISSEFKGTNAK